MSHCLHLLKKVTLYEALPPGHDKAHELRNHQLNRYNDQQPREKKFNLNGAKHHPGKDKIIGVMTVNRQFLLSR